MQVRKIFGAMVLTLILSACSSNKEINYFQDLTPGQENTISAIPDLKLQPNDKLSIVVSTSDERLNKLFNLTVSSNTIAGGNGDNGQTASYTIDSNGNIHFPVIGKIHVAGLTREQVAEHIRRELISRDLAKDPIVTVEYRNLSISVLGEVKSPGRINIPREDFTILDAIASAGDLSIFGVRDNVLVLREENGKQKVYSVNLKDGKSLVTSPVYYMQQNDVIYVESNATKARQSTANGNTWLTPSFWISIITFLSSMGVLIFK